MKKLVSLLILLPIAILLIVLSVANRHSVTFNLDPINPEQPFLALTLPFFVFLFCAVLIGMVVGSMATWFTQGKHRKQARLQKNDALKWQTEANSQKERADSAVSQMIQAPQNQAPSGNAQAPSSNTLSITDSAA